MLSSLTCPLSRLDAILTAPGMLRINLDTCAELHIIMAYKCYVSTA